MIRNDYMIYFEISDYERDMKAAIRNPDTDNVFVLNLKNSGTKTFKKKNSFFMCFFNCLFIRVYIH